MSDKFKCPLCDSVFKNKRCTNLNCKLSYAPKKEKKDLKCIFWRCVHWRPRDGYLFFKYILFKRRDLIRTGLPKTHWVDEVERMFYGIMGCVVEYVEKEQAFDIIIGDQCMTGDDETISFKQRCIELYVDFKYTYPKMKEEYEDLLTKWSDGQTMNFTPCKDRPNMSKMGWTYHRSKDEQDKLFAELNEKEDKVAQFEEDMLIRAVKMRKYLWS